MTSIPKEDERTPGPMKYWFDTEFVEDGRTIDLMSIGVVAEDGREYYAEIEECDLSRADDWVKANVIVHLTGEKKPRAVVRDELLAFMGKKPEIWAYYADYDWIALCQLFGRMIDLPDGWPMFCRDLKQLAGDTPLIKQEGTEHHALADARWTREAWLALNGSFNSLREALDLCDGLIGCQVREGVINSIDELKIIQRTARDALSGVTQPASPWTPEMKWAAMDIAQAVCDLVETLREIEKQCIQADDPEHHTLSLVKHMARNALKRFSQPSTEVEKISTDTEVLK